MNRWRFRLEDNVVGWVCAFPSEYDAATKMLDEQHHGLAQEINESILNALGRIGERNIVVVCLPTGLLGTNSAAAVAGQMLSKFTSIRYIVLVCIEGGVPTAETDIRLGDIVLSQSQNQYGGVIQYNFGKSTPCRFQRRGFLNAPPTILF